MSKFGRNYPVLGGVRVNEKERFLFIGAAGLAFSLLVIFIVVLNARTTDATQTNNQNAAPVPAGVGTVTLLTPERPIRAGSRLSDVQFKEVYWPRNQVPEGAVRDRAELANLFARVDLASGVPIQRTQLSREAMQATLPLTPGNRAVSIEVDETSGLEGHALPGTRVDLALTYYEEKELTTKVIVQNARVLSYGGDMTQVGQRGPMAGARHPSRTITLDVSPKDALQITTARQLGRISLLMRASDDDKAASVVQMDQNEVKGGSQANHGRAPRKSCGVARIEGKEFMVDCNDGSINQLMNSEEP